MITNRSAPAASVDTYVGLGSNLGDRRAHLAAALRGLATTPGLSVIASSSVYETRPVGGPPQPAYLNAVLRLACRLPPRELLDRLLALEAARGRRRSAQRNAPRSLDLDLLLYGELRIGAPGLCIPHPRLHQRAFVLEPLAEIAPWLRHPVQGVAIDRLAEAARDPLGVRRWGNPIPDPTCQTDDALPHGEKRT